MSLLICIIAGKEEVGENSFICDREENESIEQRTRKGEERYD